MITGEKIQLSCDFFVGTQRDFSYNPLIKKFSEKCIILGDNISVNRESCIFCYTHLLKQLQLLKKTLKSIQYPFTLVFHNSDDEFGLTSLTLLDEIPLLNSIYTQNMNVIHPRVEPLPIGLANSQWKHGNAKIHREVYNRSIKKNKNIYFNFSKNTNKEKRNRCYNDIIKKGVKWNKKLPYKEYLIELKKHKYAICPEGNGIDTHRFWECLYMKTIPICLKNIITQYYSSFFPLVILDNWSELSVSKLSSSYKELYQKFDDSNKYLDIDSLLKKIKL